MPRIRVLVVDDSVVMRRLVTEALAEDPDIEVVGSAASGRIALTKLRQTVPDVITLDVEMPDMNGLETLAEIRRTHARVPVIMLSALTERGASVTIQALALGATDYVTKPSQTGSADGSRKHLREQLVPKVRLLGGAPRPAPARNHGTLPGTLARTSSPGRSLRPPSHGGNGKAPMAMSVKPPGASGAGARPGVSQGLRGVKKPEVLAIGTSTGGPNALTTLLTAIGPGLGVPIVITQHMPPLFTRLLAERLTVSTRIPAREAVQGDLLVPGTVLVAPGEWHMALVRDGAAVRVNLHQGPQENSCRPAVDVMFRSVAEVYGGAALALVLTGMGQDGLRGCEVLKSVGAQVVVQDEASSVVWGMPGFVARQGLADAVMPLEPMAGEVLRRIGRGVDPRVFMVG